MPYLHGVVDRAIQHPDPTHARIKRHAYTTHTIIGSSRSCPRAARAVLIDRVGAVGVRVVILAVIRI